MAVDRTITGYQTLLASDVSSRDGIGLELYGPSGEMLIEVFLDDATGETTVWAPHILLVPVEVLEWFFAEARSRLVPLAQDPLEG
jgi:hypothetical protein